MLVNFVFEKSATELKQEQLTTVDTVAGDAVDIGLQTLLLNVFEVNHLLLLLHFPQLLGLFVLNKVRLASVIDENQNHDLIF